MPIWAQFYGGTNYSLSEPEQFRSLNAVKEAYGPALQGNDPYYPCVTEEAEVLVFSTNPWEDDDAYPVLIITCGPRGGLKVDTH